MERYVKNIKKWFTENSELGKIYDTSKPFPTHFNLCENETWENVLLDDRYHWNTLGWKTWFTPATEEEYNIQESILKPIIKEDLSYLIPILKNYNII